MRLRCRAMSLRRSPRAPPEDGQALAIELFYRWRECVELGHHTQAQQELDGLKRLAARPERGQRWDWHRSDHEPRVETTMPIRPPLPVVCSLADGNIWPGSRAGTCSRCDRQISVNTRVESMLNQAGIVRVLVCIQCWVRDRPGRGQELPRRQIAAAASTASWTRPTTPHRVDTQDRPSSVTKV